jgi:hypothetical protein
MDIADIFLNPLFSGEENRKEAKEVGKARLRSIGSSRLSLIRYEGSGKDISDQEDTRSVLGIVLEGRIIKKVLHGTQAYYSSEIQLNDEIISVGMSSLIF